MIMRILWFGGVFCLFGWIGRNWGGEPIALQPFDLTAAIPGFAPALNTLLHALKG